MDNNLGKNFNGFTIQHLLGEGGMANVYYAENSIGKAAAIKILKPSIAQDFSIQERFRQEAMVMVRLKHPNIREVYDLVGDGDDLVIVMEYLEGYDLAEIINRKGVITENTLRPLLQQILEGLGYAHRQGIVHRDIKPSNIFYTSNRQIKLLDFGIAKIAGELGQTKTGQVMGSPLYMSPEQVKGSKEIDQRTDIYSLGVCVYNLITGQKPYDHRSLSEFEIQTKIVKDSLPKLSEASPALNRIVSMCTEKEPTQRFQNCQEILDALKKPIVVPRKKKKSNNKALLWGLGGVLLTGIIILINVMIPVPVSLLEPETVFVEGGRFEMGCIENDESCYDDELPVHIVNISSFSMGKYEVTNEEFCQFLNEAAYQIDNDTLWFESDKILISMDNEYVVQEGYERYPIVDVSWNGAKAYCKWLSDKTGKDFNLPSEAQWEYAARGGIVHSTTLYSGSNNLDEVAVYDEESELVVGSKKANLLGIYDLSGNVYEWVLDNYHKSYKNAPSDGRAWFETGNDEKVLRGGGFANNSEDDDLGHLMIKYRVSVLPYLRFGSYGFRVVENQ